MRIGIDVRALMEGKTTGVETYITGLLHSIFRLDQKNEYVLFANNLRDIRGNLPKFDYPNVRYRIFRYPNKFFNLAQILLHYPKIETLLGPLDLYFSPHWRYTAMTAQTPLIITFHDLSFEIYPQFFTFRRRLWHHFMNYRQAAHRANKLIAVSQSTKNDLQKFYKLPDQKIQVMYPGINMPTDKIEPLPLGLPERYFLFFGTFEPRKNISAVLEAYQQYIQQSSSPLPLVMAGNKGWLTGNFSVDPSLKGRVIIFNNVSDGARRILYQKAFAFLFLSFYEGFGFPILEAALAGVPVIASNATSLGEVGRDFVLFVNPFRCSPVAEAMLNLEADKKLYAALKQRGLSAAKAYDWENTARQTLSLFEEVTR